MFSGTGTIGRTAYIEEEPSGWGIKEGVYALTFDADIINPVFALHLFHSTQSATWFAAAAEGGTVVSVSMAKMKQFPIPVPPREEQERIVAILDKFDVLVNDISQGLPAEIEARRKQYAYYRDKLLTFKEKVA